jgi:hypothetical protein
MHIGNCFVTGSVEPADLGSALRAYDLQALFLVATRPIFGHPTTGHAFGCGLPLAYFDWSKGGVQARKGDLALDPEKSLDDTLALMRRWLLKP